jgi:hypothetical protein
MKPSLRRTLVLKQFAQLPHHVQVSDTTEDEQNY